MSLNFFVKWKPPGLSFHSIKAERKFPLIWIFTVQWRLRTEGQDFPRPECGSGGRSYLGEIALPHIFPSALLDETKIVFFRPSVARVCLKLYLCIMVNLLLCACLFMDLWERLVIYIKNMFFSVKITKFPESKKYLSQNRSFFNRPAKL